MKTPRQVTEIVTLTYWACGVCKKRHKTEAAAQKCIDDSLKAPQSIKWTTDKLKTVISQREEEKMSFKDIGAAWGVGDQRARAVYNEAKYRFR